MRKRFPRPVTVQEAQDPTRFFNIPLALIEVVVKERMFGPFRLFLYLKTQSIGGQLRPDPALFTNAAADLHLHPKSISRHFQALRKRNWIGQFNNGGLILRSFKNLQGIEKAYSRSAVIFDKTKHLDQTKAFVIAAALGKLILNQKTRWVAKLQGEQNGTPNESIKPPTTFEISCEAFSKIFGVSISTASLWKREAHKAGFAKVMPTLRPMRKIDNVKEWKRSYPDFAHRLIIRDNTHFVQYPDKVECLLSFCRTRNPLPNGQKSKHPNRQLNKINRPNFKTMGLGVYMNGLNQENDVKK